MIVRIEAHRYRCFEHLDIALGPYQVLAGANGAGKSTLLDIPLLMVDLLERGMRGAFLEALPGGQGARAQSYDDLIFRAQPAPFGLAVEARLPGDIVETLLARAPKTVKNDPSLKPTRIRYEIIFGSIGLAWANNEAIRTQRVPGRGSFHISVLAPRDFLYVIPDESTHSLPRTFQEWDLRERPAREGWQPVILSSRGKSGAISEDQIEFKAEYLRRKLAFRLDQEKPRFAYLPPDPDLFPASTWFKSFLQTRMMRYEPDMALLRSACPPGQPRQMRANAANLPWQVLRLQTEQPERLEAWVEHVRTALPNLEAIHGVEREEDHHAYLKLDYAGGYSVTSSGLSDGTLRILAFTILPYLIDLPQFICVEEPENGIHPRGIETILQSLSSLYDGQTLITTHSPVVLAHTPLDQIIALRRGPEGANTAVPGNKHPRLLDWKGGIDLGTLFAAGVLE